MPAGAAAAAPAEDEAAVAVDELDAVDDRVHRTAGAAERPRRTGGEALHRLGGEEVRLRGELDLLQLSFLREALGRLGSWTETILCTRR